MTWEHNVETRVGKIDIFYGQKTGQNVIILFDVNPDTNNHFCFYNEDFDIPEGFNPPIALFRIKKLYNVIQPE